MRGDMAETIEERVRRLEDVAFEGDGLTRSIDRLGLNADALGQALLQVDKQQQVLTKLGTEIGEVRDASITRNEVRETERRRATDTLSFRKTLLSRIYATAIILALLIVGTIAGLQERADKQRESRRTLCQASASTAENVQRFTTDQITIERTNRFIDDALRRKRIASLETFRLAFPDPPCLKEFPK